MSSPEDSDDSGDDFMIFPLLDLDSFNDDDKDDSNEDKEPPSPSTDSGNTSESDEDEEQVMANRRRYVSLQQRRMSKLGYNIALPTINQENLNRFNNKENVVTEEVAASPPLNAAFSPAKVRWLGALKKIRLMKDPWASHHLEKLPVETVCRHRYNPLLKKWVQDKVKVHMQSESFNRGAMRACYRLLKHTTNKRQQSRNYVAKKYMESVERDVYFEDVRLQMDAKLWGEEYNRHRPPKQVDIFQMNIIEFINRQGSPLYHLEHLIEGDYIKYNSNSGFVEESVRLTPQAFSHFTFERSGHQLIIVDVQGVGDLWTDPQIHTADGEGYGSGNLGSRGMALFFHSHVCNSICHNLRLSKFDLSRKETTDLGKFVQMQKNAITVVKGRETAVSSPSPTEKIDLTSFLARSRTFSRTSSGFHEADNEEEEEEDDIMPEPPMFPRRQRSQEQPMLIGSPVISTEQLRELNARIRYRSESEDSGADTMTEEEERVRFQQLANRQHRPSCITLEIHRRKTSVDTCVGDSVLGQIHHDLAKYHELGRFAENENEVDWEAALFHEQQAAQLGVMEAILTLAKLFLGMQPDVLVNCVVKNSDSNQDDGIHFMQMAANYGDRSAMLFMAEAYESGNNLGKHRSKSFADAIHWYEKVANCQEDDDSGDYDATMDTPVHIIKAKMADMYLQGGFGLEKDPSYSGDLYNEAAEEAMAAMKGRLANKYYALAEEAYAQVEE